MCVWVTRNAVVLIKFYSIFCYSLCEITELSSTKVLVLEDPQGPIYKSLSSDLKSLKIFEDSAFCNLHPVEY